MDLRRARALADRGLNSLPGRVIRKFAADNGPNQAILIAWNVLFSIFPIALAMAAVLGLILTHAGVKADAVYQTVLAIVPDDKGRAQALSGLESLKRQSGLFFLIGLGGFIWSGSSLFGAMEQSFDVIFHCPQRNFIRQKLMGFLMMLLFTLLAGIAVGTSALLPLLKLIPVVPVSWTQSASVYVLQPIIGVLSGVLLFGSLYFVVPNRKQRITEVWPGALLAGVAFYALTLLFPLYLSFNKGLNQYGASFAFLFIVMNFFYFLGLVTMLGVELNAVLYPVPIEPATANVPGPSRGKRAPARQREERPRRSVRGAVRGAAFAVVAAAIGVFAFSRRRDLS
ncbi:MAG: YihY/virulence factor BrkB family protein [Chloroflexi bacterium]|nr:MAG: YihY/virulence factor BrkB family protein [Chloroflexota bacterium]